jgi:hypothetical protein
MKFGGVKDAYCTFSPSAGFVACSRSIPFRMRGKQRGSALILEQRRALGLESASGIDRPFDANDRAVFSPIVIGVDQRLAPATAQLEAVAAGALATP